MEAAIKEEARILPKSWVSLLPPNFFGTWFFRLGKGEQKGEGVVWPSVVSRGTPHAESLGLLASGCRVTRTLASRT